VVVEKLVRVMDTFELKKEQLKLAAKIVVRDGFSTVKTIGAVICQPFGTKLMAIAVVCTFPSSELIEKKTFLLENPLPYKPGYEAYREMPAMIEAYNQLEQEPDLLLVYGTGVLHPRGLGIASHLGLALNKATMGIISTLLFGKVEKGKIIVDGEVKGFEITTRQHANPIYVSPGHLVSVGTVLHIIPQLIQYPHKLPEPLHLAQKMVKKNVKNLRSNDTREIE